MSIRMDLKNVSQALWFGERVRIKPLETQDELIYALFECTLTEDQMDLVNPAGFSIGRAYLFREDNCPCIIFNNANEPVGFINLCKWLGKGDAYSWSFFIDSRHQGKGYGRSAAETAVRLLKAANPSMAIKLSAEKNNESAQRLYRSLGFRLLSELDGDDLVFEL